jgi:hypothetical protein
MVNAASSTNATRTQPEMRKIFFYLNELRRTVNRENTFRETRAARTRFLKGCKRQHGPAAIAQ